MVEVPFHFWSIVFFWLGAIVGSFLNVCIHRMPIGQSIVSPPSHCPNCKYSIPWYLNIPLVTWVYLRGKCKNCAAPISPRYFLVELLTAISFLSCWVIFGGYSPLVAGIYCILMSGLIVATFIDFEHFIIPDEITIGGIVVGFLCSFAVPALHGFESSTDAMKHSFSGVLVGGGIVYAILRGGKLFFGKQKLELAPNSRIIFTETQLLLPDKPVPYDEIFYRDSDTIIFTAENLELIDRCYTTAEVRVTPKTLKINDEVLEPEKVPHMEAITSKIVIPREAMGFGDVKFMAGIGAFLGWPAVLFILGLSSMLGAAVGVVLIVLGKRAWSSRIPYGPYIAAAAAIWVLAIPARIWWLQHLYVFKTMLRQMFS